MTLPTNIVVVGTGGGGLTIAAELGLLGNPATIVDQPQFAAGLAAISTKGGIDVQFRASPRDTAPPTVFAPVRAVSDDPVTAVQEAELIIVCVPSFGHKPVSELLASAWTDGQSAIFVGEGGGSLSAVAALRAIGRKVDVTFGETNSLPYGGAFSSEPGTVGATKKIGGTLVAALPANRGNALHALAAEIWPWVTPAQNAWETVLLNFNAIDHVPAMICNLGSIEQPSGTYRIWGEGGTAGVANVIAALDGEYLAIRAGLGLTDLTPYEDYLVAQGMVTSKEDTLSETIRGSIMATVEFPCGPNALQHRFVSEDVPYSLVLASSLGAELGISTPVVDGLVAVASAASGIDYRAIGRTLEGWALEGVGLGGLQAAVEDGWW